MASAYQLLIFLLIEVNGHPIPIRKYVHMNKSNEIINKNIFHLVVNIVSKNIVV
jgi:hypothetical protein